MRYFYLIIEPVVAGLDAVPNNSSHQITDVIFTCRPRADLQASETLLQVFRMDKLNDLLRIRVSCIAEKSLCLDEIKNFLENLCV